jgi:cytochrome o ubiquinol oxidase subunit II
MKKSLLYSVLLSIGAAISLGGCKSLLLFDPKGEIGEAQKFVIILAIILMLIVVVPVFIMAFWFPRKYRASNNDTIYNPKWSYSGKIEFVMWTVPFIIVAFLAILAWKSTHALDPYKPINAAQHLNIHAISMDWKWLFIYPDHNVAVVNELTLPVNVPLSFKLTSDTVMTSFFIPQLGSQMYAMGGMQTKLHLVANEPGVYLGQNQQFSGRGYSDMQFNVNVVSPEEFESWIQKIKQSQGKLDSISYDELSKPSIGNPVTYFSSVTPDLFGYVIRKFHPTWSEHHHHMGGASVPAHTTSDVVEAH